MKKLLIILLIIIPQLALAQEGAREDSVFKAEVIEIIAEERVAIPGGKEQVQQNLRLVGLEGEFTGETLEFYGIGELEVISSQIYKAGDKVILAASFTPDGEAIFYVVDYVRTSALWWFAALFLVVLFC